jgi:DNA-binding MarR family transcriptional regulator
MSEKLDKQSIQSISDLGRQFSDATIFMHEAIAKSVGLTGTDHKYLGLLIRHGEMTAGELSKLTGLTTGAVTGLVDRLEKKKLVKRAFDKDDRRKIVVVPDTAYAMRLLGDPFSTLQKKMVKLISTLTEKETDIIRKYLISTIEVMKEVTNNLNVK